MNKKKMRITVCSVFSDQGYRRINLCPILRKKFVCDFCGGDSTIGSFRILNVLAFLLFTFKRHKTGACWGILSKVNPFGPF